MGVKDLALLQDSYVDGKGLVEFTKLIRTKKNDFSGKYSIKLAELNRLFSSSVWVESASATGHRKLTHKVTGICIEYAKHGDSVNPGRNLGVFDAVQHHLNILSNHIFCFKTYSWKETPDYEASAIRLEQWYKEPRHLQIDVDVPRKRTLLE